MQREAKKRETWSRSAKGAPSPGFLFRHHLAVSVTAQKRSFVAVGWSSCSEWTGTELYRSPGCLTLLLSLKDISSCPFSLCSAYTIIPILACALPLSAFALEFKSCVCFIKGSLVWASEIHMHSPTVWVFSFLPSAQITHCNMINEWGSATLFIVYSFYSALPPYVINSWSTCSV